MLIFMTKCFCVIMLPGAIIIDYVLGYLGQYLLVRQRWHSVIVFTGMILSAGAFWLLAALMANLILSMCVCDVALLRSSDLDVFDRDFELLGGNVSALTLRALISNSSSMVVIDPFLNTPNDMLRNLFKIVFTISVWSLTIVQVSVQTVLAFPGYGCIVVFVALLAQAG